MITSATNAKVRYVRRLAHRAFRARERHLVLEGVRLVADALDAACLPAFVLVTAELSATPRGQALRRRLEAAAVPLFELAPGLFREMAETVRPQGILAVVSMPELPPPTDPDLVLVLDAIRDPGNLGAALRSALAAGADVALLAPGTVDATNPKVVRAAMGAHFRLPVRRANWTAVASAVRGLAVWVADPAGAVEHTAVDWRTPSALVVGGEAGGPSAGARELGQTVKIRMPGAAESLNAATAAAVILFEAARQRGG